MLPTGTTFEQRWGFGDKQRVSISPELVIHWAYNKRYLYGRSLFREVLHDWERLKEADEDLFAGARSAGVQPNIHIMPPGADESYKRAYREDFEAKRKEGVIPDIFLLQGADVKRPAGQAQAFPISGLLENWNARRLRIAARSRVPTYLLGIETRFAKEIATQPAIAFIVFTGVVRQLFAKGLRQLIDLELALKQVPKPWHYRIVFPQISLNPYLQTLADDVDQPGVEDVD